MSQRRGSDLPAPEDLPVEEAPLFDGDTFRPRLDADRLARQVRAVFDLMKDGAWRTLFEVSEAVGAPEASVSARLRDLRKARFGGWNVGRRRRGQAQRGLFEYQLTAFAPKEPG